MGHPGGGTDQQISRRGTEEGGEYSYCMGKGSKAPTGEGPDNRERLVYPILYKKGKEIL